MNTSTLNLVLVSLAVAGLTLCALDSAWGETGTLSSNCDYEFYCTTANPDGSCADGQVNTSSPCASGSPCTTCTATTSWSTCPPGHSTCLCTEGEWAHDACQTCVKSDFTGWVQSYSCHSTFACPPTSDCEPEVFVSGQYGECECNGG